MSNSDTIPELREILGALILAARRPVTVKEMWTCLRQAAEIHGGCAASFAAVAESDVSAALAELKAEVEASRTGLHLMEVAGGYRFQTDDSCGPWVRTLLNVNQRHHLSRPALETLAIIAYRQPLTRAEIEAIRGVNIDHVIHALMEMQLVKLTGRSKLPGRPLLYGTTKLFLEHFGLNSVGELPGIEQLSRIDRNRSLGRGPAQPQPEAAAAEAGVNEAPAVPDLPEPVAEAAAVSPAESRQDIASDGEPPDETETPK